MCVVCKEVGVSMFLCPYMKLCICLLWFGGGGKCISVVALCMDADIRAREMERVQEYVFMSICLFLWL